MNQNEFAKRVGVTPGRVSRFIRDGILTENSIKKKARGWDINLRRGRADLKANLDPMRKVKATKAVPKKKPRTVVKKKIRTAKPKKKKAPVEVEAESLQDARTRKERALADKHEFENLILQNKYILISAFEEAITKTIRAAKIRLLGIPSKITPVAREMIEDKEIADTILQMIEAEVEGALVELSNSKI